METIKLSSKGQVVLPRSVRAARNWKSGTTLVIENRPEGVLILAAKPFVETNLDQVVGAAKYRGPRKTLKDMEDAIVREACKRG